MQDLNVIDQFMQAFIAYIDSGFGLLGGDVGFLTTILIGIDITLAGLFWALGGEDDVIGKFLKKILYVGAFALILNSFSTLSDIIFRSFAGLGLTAGGSAITAQDLLMPGKLAGTGFTAAWPLLEQAKELVGPIAFFDNFVEIAAGQRLGTVGDRIVAAPVAGRMLFPKYWSREQQLAEHAAQARGEPVAMPTQLCRLLRPITDAELPTTL